MLAFVKTPESLKLNVKKYANAARLARNKGGQPYPNLVRVWYYAPSLDMVGASRFIGYEDMTFARYNTNNEVDSQGHSLHGGRTESHLKRMDWFRQLAPSEPEYQKATSAILRIADSIRPGAKIYLLRREHDSPAPTLNLSRSRKLFSQAQALIPGGVNSPVRSFRAVGGQPPFIQKGKGSRLWDVDGNQYIDYVGSWGPLILGHAAPEIVAAVQQAAALGTSFGAPTEGEGELARLIHEAVPSMEMVRFVNSGTEATMSALRLARAYTGRSKVVKFAGCYHGHADGLLVQAGSGSLTHGMPSSAGVPAAYAQETLVAQYNDVPSVERLFDEYAGQIACVIVEPVAGNMGVVPPAQGFLAALKRITSGNNALLIFDEVITGFRVSYGGAQALYGVTPDITCLGKVIGGGLPVGAYGGRREIMEVVAPLGPMYQAGTLSGNPLAVAAGIAALKALQQPGTYQRLERTGALLAAGLAEAAREAKVPATVNRVGSLLTAFFCAGPVASYADVQRADTRAYGRYFHAMLERGIYLAPSQFEAAFVSLAHTEEDIRQTLTAAREALKGDA